MRGLISLAILFLAVSIEAQSIDHQVVSDRLLTEIKSHPQAYHRIYILLKDQVDTRALDASFYRRELTLQQRVFELLTTLQDHASKSQLNVLNQLRQGDEVQPNSIRSFWIGNIIFASVRREKIAQLSHHPSISWIDLNGQLEMSRVEKVQAPPSPPFFDVQGIEPGLEAINAPAMWQLGYTGYGRIAFANDTGVDPDHPAISGKYRGIYASAQQSWFQYNSSNTTPFDCDSHGTHTLGTIMGLDRNTSDTIGVAFNALWIGAPILCGLGTEDNIASFQWALDPDGNPETIEDMPDVINNSWFDPSIENDCNNVYNLLLDALEAAGVAVIFSAGNEGPDSATITPPHNISTDEINSFTVGAVNANSSTLPIADFSSRGPSNCNDGNPSLQIKPEVSAPGVSVRSCVPGKAYDFFSGTSMAAPHVSGSILLLKEAFPYLTGREIKMAIYQSCRDLGAVGEDNEYGMGLIDVRAAYEFLIGEGHQPVSPQVQYDVLLVDVRVNPRECDRQINPTVVIENAGQDTLRTMEFRYQAEGFAATGEIAQWQGLLPPGQQLSLALPPLVVIPGQFNLSVTAFLPNQQPDQRPLNNRIIKQVKVIKQPSIDVFSHLGASPSICENGNVLLQSNYQGSGWVQWFDQPSGGQMIGTGNPFLLNSLKSDTTVYADVLEHNVVGKADLSGGRIENEGGDFGRGLLFDAQGAFMLKSVKVYANNKGARILSLLDGDKRKIREKVLLVRDTGEQRVTLDMFIPAGTNYQLVLTEGKPFLYNGSGADYPYEIDELVKIRQSNHPQFKKQVYYYFYDWEVEYQAICGRKALSLQIVPGDEVPLVGFEFEYLSTGGDTLGFVDFTDRSEGAVQWWWNFGDGSSSSEQNPRHEYTQNGSYTVSLTVTSASGCTNVTTQPIEISHLELSTAVHPPQDAVAAIKIYPNPASNRLFLSLDLNSARNIRIDIFDVLGRRLQTAIHPPTQSLRREVDIRSLNEGIYFVLVEMEGTRILKKFLVLR